MRELKTTRNKETDEWLRVSSQVAKIAASSTGAKAAFIEAASALQAVGPMAVAMVVAPFDQIPQGYAFGFSETFANRAASLYEKGYRLEDPVRGSSSVRTDYVLWPELAREGVSLFAAWPLCTAGRCIGELHVGIWDEASFTRLPPDEFMETFAGALALVIDRNSLLSSSQAGREERSWHLKLLDSMVQGTTDAVCATDSMGRVFLLNPAAEEMLGLREGEVLGRRFSDVDNRLQSISHIRDGSIGTVFHAILKPSSEATESIEAFRVSGFDHGGREYSSWVLRRSASISGVSANVSRQYPSSDEGVLHDRIAVFSCDKDGRIISKSGSLASFLGVSPGELESGSSIRDLRVFRTARMAEIVFKCMESNVPEVSSHELSHRIRGTINLTLHCTPIVQSNRETIGVQVVLEDTTDMVRTRTSLNRSEERYRVFFNSAPISLVELDLSLTLSNFQGTDSNPSATIDAYEKIRVVAVNPAATALYTAASASGLKDLWVTLNEKTVQRLIEQLNVLGQSDSSICFESTAKTMTGDTIEVSVCAAIAPGYEQDLSKIMVSIADITQMKSMEQVLRKQLAMERLVSRISKRFVGMAPENTSEGIEAAMEEIGAVLGLDVVALFERGQDDTITARHIWQSPDTPDMTGDISSLFKTDFPVFSDLIDGFKVIRVDSPSNLPEAGNERGIVNRLGISRLLMIPMVAQGLIRGALVLASKEENRWGDENIALLRVIADVAADALDREQREHHRRESEDLLGTVFQSMVGGLIVTGPDGLVLLANPSAALSLKMKRSDELIGRSIGDVVKGGMGLLHPSLPGEQQQIVLTLQDGTRCTFGFTTAVSTSGRCIVLFRDLSLMIEAGRRQKRAEELARLGMVTAKLSHEIKNPLSSILLGLSTLEENKSMTEDDLFVLRSVLQEVRYLKSFVGNLLDTMRFHDVAPILQSIHPIAYGVIESQSRVAERSGVRLKLVQGPASAVACADKPAMIRALGNLVKNAVEACSPNDEIEIGWRYLSRDEVEDRFTGYTGEVLCLYVEDNGPGLPKSVMENLFVPFTTTKSMGTGLGLSVVQETVAGHGGVIEVVTPANPSGKGTRFEILIPRGTRPSCLDLHGDLAGCESCPVPEGCPVREVEGYLSCWTIKGKASMAETGKWNEDCVECPVYLKGNLEPFHHRSFDGRKGK
jgi:nitrogen fixation/metabolism regulation signal transduction histidine kinase